MLNIRERKREKFAYSYIYDVDLDLDPDSLTPRSWTLHKLSTLVWTTLLVFRNMSRISKDILHQTYY